MTIQQLNVFLAVCNDMNYTKAASRVYMSRQAVRQNIAELEKELNGPLLENRGNRLYLTAKGELLKAKAAPLLEDFRELQSAMNADIRLEHPIRLGISVAVIPDYLPGLLGYLNSFMQSYPNLPVETIRVENDEAASALLSGTIDAGIVLDLSGKSQGIERSVLTFHPAAVMVKNTDRLFGREQISVSELSGKVMYLPGLGEEFAPLLRMAEQESAEIDFTVMPSFYQVLFHIQDRGGVGLNRYIPDEDTDPTRVRSIPLRNLPPLCSSFLVREGELSSPLHLLRDWISGRLQEEFRE